jgi:hypothetical protein
MVDRCCTQYTPSGPIRQPQQAGDHGRTPELGTMLVDDRGEEPTLIVAVRCACSATCEDGRPADDLRCAKALMRTSKHGEYVLMKTCDQAGLGVILAHAQVGDERA